MEDAPGSTFQRSVANAIMFEDPYRHWLLQFVLEPGKIQALRALPFLPISRRGDGTRASLPAAAFLNRDACSTYPIFLDLVRTFAERKAVAELERRCGICLDGTSLRISYHIDANEFWLSSHTDISDKILTLIVIVQHDPADDPVGTEMHDVNGLVVKRAPSADNSGFMFLPGNDTYHGFARRSLKGIRSTLVVNFVARGWNNENELAPIDVRSIGSRLTPGVEI